MRDSQGKTGEEIIGSISKEALLECYTTDDIKEDYNNLRSRLSNPETTNSEFTSLLRLAWEFTVSKPPQAKDITSKGESLSAGIFIKGLEDEDEEDI